MKKINKHNKNYNKKYWAGRSLQDLIIFLLDLGIHKPTYDELMPDTDLFAEKYYKKVKVK